MARSTKTQIAGVELTANEVAALSVFMDSQYYSGEGIENFRNWSWDFADLAVGATGLTPKGVTGVISSLSKKGLVDVWAKSGKDGDDASIALTTKGVEVYLAITDSALEVAEEAPAEEAPAEEAPAEMTLDELAAAIESVQAEDVEEAPAPAETTVILLWASQIVAGDQLLGYPVGKVTVGRVRTTVWAEDGTELLYTLNKMVVRVVRQVVS